MRSWIVPAAQQVKSPSIYPGRPPEIEVDLLVVHYTAGSGNAAAVGAVFKNPTRQASAHFAVGRTGDVVQCVGLGDAAWHAGDRGKSRFPRLPDPNAGGLVPLAGVPKVPRLVNKRSVGIELCNLGYAVSGLPPARVVAGTHRNPRSKKPSWEKFPQPQIDALVALVAEIQTEVPSLRWVCGHEDVTHYDVTGMGSKVDPGPAFPWDCLEPSGLRRVQYDFAAKGWRTL